MRTRRIPRTRGFTLIEQVAVIALVGAASAAAMPRLVELRSEADALALTSLAAAAGSAMQLNQGACLVTAQVATPGKCLTVRHCRQAQDLLAADLPAGMRIDDRLIADGVNGVEVRCTLTHVASGRAMDFRGIATGH